MLELRISVCNIANVQESANLSMGRQWWKKPYRKVSVIPIRGREPLWKLDPILVQVRYRRSNSHVHRMWFQTHMLSLPLANPWNMPHGEPANSWFSWLARKDGKWVGKSPCTGTKALHLKKASQGRERWPWRRFWGGGGKVGSGC